MKGVKKMNRSQTSQRTKESIKQVEILDLDLKRLSEFQSMLASGQISILQPTLGSSRNESITTDDNGDFNKTYGKDTYGAKINAYFVITDPPGETEYEGTITVSDNDPTQFKVVCGEASPDHDYETRPPGKTTHLTIQGSTSPPLANTEISFTVYYYIVS